MKRFKYIFLAILFVNIAYGQSEFMKICANPTPEQKNMLEEILRKEITLENCEKFEIFQKNLDGKTDYFEYGHVDYSRIRLSDENNRIIEDISPLSVFVNMENLSLSKNNISDISVLKYMPKLRMLTLDDNPINDISVLSNLTNLGVISLSQNNLKDLKPIENLKKLNWLVLYGEYGKEQLSEKKISEFNKLRKLRKITPLTKNLESEKQTPIDLSALKKLPNLKELSLQGVNVKDICALNGLDSLEELTIGSYYIPNIDCVKDLKNLKKIELVFVDSIDSLKHFKNLENVKIESSLIKNLDSLKELPKLEFVAARRSALEDTSGLVYNKNVIGLDSFDSPNIKWYYPTNGTQIKIARKVLDFKNYLKNLFGI